MLISGWKSWDSQPIFGDYLVECLESSSMLPLPDAEALLTLGNEYFSDKSPLQQGVLICFICVCFNSFLSAKWNLALGRYYCVSGRPNVTASLEHYQKALSWSNMAGSPTTPGTRALSGISMLMFMTGDILGALLHAKKAQDYAEHLGDIYSQARCHGQQGQCLLVLGNYQQSQSSFVHTRELLQSCGHQESLLDLDALSSVAELHLLKTEYLESRHIQISITAHSHPTTHTVMANLKIALIDTMTGVDSKLVHQNLNTCQLHAKGLQGWAQIIMNLTASLICGDLLVQDGDYTAANVLLAQTFASSQYIYLDLALMFLARLADLSTEMSDVKTTMGWAGLFLALALKSRNKLGIMKAFRCLGQIFAAQGDDDIALSLFTVALDGFTFMDVHHWRADCMVHIGDIWERRGEIMKSVELWKATRPLLQRASQAKDIARVDRKLADVDLAIMEKYERRLG
jgi:tetratricopeptide (TPR) repeat protein